MAETGRTPDVGIGAKQTQGSETPAFPSNSRRQQDAQEAAVNLESANLGTVAIGSRKCPVGNECNRDVSPTDLEAAL